jgi:hypothetical protein
MSKLTQKKKKNNVKKKIHNCIPTKLLTSQQLQSCNYSCQSIIVVYLMLMIQQTDFNPTIHIIQKFNLETPLKIFYHSYPHNPYVSHELLLVCTFWDCGHSFKLASIDTLLEILLLNIDWSVVDFHVVLYEFNLSCIWISYKLIVNHITFFFYVIQDFYINLI